MDFKLRQRRQSKAGGVGISTNVVWRDACEHSTWTNVGGYGLASVKIFVTSLVIAFAFGLVAVAAVASPVEDRTAIELVYYNHRTGTKPTFAQALPADQIEKLVALEAKKEAVLQRVYGVVITDAMVEAEVRRINETTRAPEVLAELKSALNNDPVRFARSLARPIVVERTLRTRFENDDKLHAPERAKMEELRTRVLGARDASYADRLVIVQNAKLGDVPELTWQLAPRPAESRTPAPPAGTSTSTEVKARSSAYSIEATAQVAQVIASPEKSAGDRERMLYFEDLPPELQNVLRAQLRKSGDVSAVIETPQGFLLYLAKSRTEDTLAVAVLSLPKRSYEEWLASVSI